MPSETLELAGHIIDSQLLSRVLDEIMRSGAAFTIHELRVGQTPTEPSHCRLEVSCATDEQLAELLTTLTHYGATPAVAEDVHLVPAERDGVLPDDFYVSTSQTTHVRWQGRWHEVRNQEMDCAIVWDEGAQGFRCCPMTRIRRGDLVVVGTHGIRVRPLERGRSTGVFEFMSSTVSSEKPKNVIIRQIAEQMHHTRQSGRRILLVAGPAIVHTGASRHIVRMIERGFVHTLFAGNALAVHDIEQVLFGTSLGIHMDDAAPVETGHEHHMRAINLIRRAGGIEPAVRQGILRTGIMHACVRCGVDVVLAGSIRDDGPLPEVITDALHAQDAMRERIPQVGLALMIATALHSIAVGNLLPATVPVVCVDINPQVPLKLCDRGTLHAVGLVTDVEPFLHELVDQLESLDAPRPTAR